MPVRNKAFDSLEEDFKPIVEDILSQLEAQDFQPFVCEGRRTKAQQAEKVRLGYSKTMNSYHLSGLAADIVDKRYMWNVPVTHPFFIALGNIVKGIEVEGGHLRWGGDWNVPGRFEILKKKGKINWFVDVAHVELRRDK